MRNPEVIETLRQARDLISDPERWTRGAMARDKDGNPTPVEGPRAVCFCASGAVIHCAPNERVGIEACEFLRKAAGTSIPVFNDQSDAPPLWVLDQAIKEASNA